VASFSCQGENAARKSKSLAQFELLGDCGVAAYIGVVKVIQQPAALAHHHQQSPARAVVFHVLLQMLRQMIDPLRQQRNLDVSRTGVPFMQFKI